MSEVNIHSLIVMDERSGLPGGFLPTVSNGLGMTIIQSLVSQIGGSTHFVRGVCITSAIISFSQGTNLLAAV